MASFNKVILIGNITANPELKQTTSGESVTSFSIAVNRKYGKNNECDFITIVAWKERAEFVCRYFKKGTPILVCGQLQTRSWTDAQGNKRTSVEVVADEVTFVAPANQNEQKPTAQTPPDPSKLQGTTAYRPDAYSGTNNANFEEIPNDGDLPF